jgi:hypothetical protein
VAAACLLVGLALSVVSVPVAAVVAQFGPAYTGRGQMVHSYDLVLDGVAYEVAELSWIDATGRRRRPVLMGQQRREPASWSGVADMAGPVIITATRHFDTQAELQAFLRGRTAPGPAAIGASSTGWPMHAAHSTAHLEAHPGTARREHGLLRFTILGKAFVLPVLPTWTGLLGNTLLYGGTLLLAWWILRGRRLAQRRARGACLACGYTLDAGMERCPECGVACHPSAAT